MKKQNNPFFLPYAFKLYGIMGLAALALSFFMIGVDEYKKYSKRHQYDYEVVGKNGVKYESYKEACEDGDFAAAHKCLIEIAKLRGENSSEYREGCADVFSNESKYLISTNDETSAKRLIFLLSELEDILYTSSERTPSGSSNEHYTNEHDSRCISLLNLAISVGNKYVIKMILPQLIKQENKNIAKEKCQKTIENGFLFE